MRPFVYLKHFLRHARVIFTPFSYRKKIIYFIRIHMSLAYRQGARNNNYMNNKRFVRDRKLIWIFFVFLLADSYQYQLQSMWQKCWNTNQSLVHNLRFRERGPLKSWRPETMAEAIFSVLKEGLSLSQAARKYDIPYPTFVLYANRVHNMLGPSADGGSGELIFIIFPNYTESK